MAVPTNTIQAVGRVGVREDLSDQIHVLFPDDCPFQAAIERTSAGQVYHEWQTDGLAAANADNKTIQGDDLSNDSRPNTVRQGNYTQIMKKVVGASTTMEATRTAGRSSELAREIMKAGREIKTDAELRFTSIKAAVAPASGTAGECAGALAFLQTNVDRGATGANGTYSGGGQAGYVSVAPTNGTLRAATETAFNALLRAVWTQGGDPKMALMSMALKKKAGTFAGIAQQRRETGDKLVSIVAGADFYVGDAGTTQLVPSRFTTGRDIFVFDPSQWAVAQLESLKMIDLAKTGLATRKAMYQEVTLECRNEKASGVYADLDPAL